MLFCPKCGTLLILKKSGSRKVMSCSCGYSTSDVADTTIREELGKKEKSVDVVESEIETLPLTSADCPKCKHKFETTKAIVHGLSPIFVEAYKRLIKPMNVPVLEMMINGYEVG